MKALIRPFYGGELLGKTPEFFGNDRIHSPAANALMGRIVVIGHQWRDVAVRAIPPEAMEVSDCSLEFAREALAESYQKLEAIVASALKGDRKSSATKKLPSPVKTAHLLVSATRGFKLVARNSGELRKMIQDLLSAIL
jgi:hypothetical protein